jgi:hypothetical protein
MMWRSIGLADIACHIVDAHFETSVLAYEHVLAPPRLTVNDETRTCLRKGSEAALRRRVLKSRGAAR